MNTTANRLSLASLTMMSAIAFASGPESTPTPPNGFPQTASETAFLNAWASGESSSDLNQDGGVDGADIEMFYRSLAHPLSRADVNGDSRITGEDLALFFIFFSTGDERADLNGDGGVDGSDIDEWFACAGSVSLDDWAHNAEETDLERDPSPQGPWNTNTTTQR